MINVLIRGFQIYSQSLQNLLNADPQIRSVPCLLVADKEENENRYADFAGCHFCLLKSGKCLQVLNVFQPDVLLLDIESQGINDNSTIKKIKLLYPKIKILVLSNNHEIASIIEMIESGVNGYLLKDIEINELIVAIKNINGGKNYFHNTIISRIIEHNKSGEKKINLLTIREVEILKLISEQKSNKEIAEELFISLHTVISHRKSILKKLKVKNTAGMIQHAFKNKLLVHA